MFFLGFLIGCWIGCLAGFFLAYLLRGRAGNRARTSAVNIIPHDPPGIVSIR